MTLADVLAVMRDGVLQQVGTPEESTPGRANTFVASFIGSPRMNLLEGRIEGGRFTLVRRTGPTIVMPEAAGGQSGSDVVLGIRPEHVGSTRTAGSSSGST